MNDIQMTNYNSTKNQSVHGINNKNMHNLSGYDSSNTQFN